MINNVKWKFIINAAASADLYHDENIDGGRSFGCMKKECEPLVIEAYYFAP